ncbi:MAG TPA: hypothetical protein PLV68_13660, partial [Ilumatobacteraceae bacterium]|nr:hypothetical protein [Ilumatobacteraceae bacterium]
ADATSIVHSLASPDVSDDVSAAPPTAAAAAIDLDVPDLHVPDLDVIERDLADVEIALSRLEAGTYWTCEDTGQPLPDALLAARPTARTIH